jgi:hypothetical protein
VGQQLFGTDVAPGKRQGEQALILAEGRGEGGKDSGWRGGKGVGWVHDFPYELPWDMTIPMNSKPGRV